jgi:hypothetical protein
MGNGRYSNEYIQVYLMCEKFHCLPFEGGYFDQPARWIEAFELIQSIIDQYNANK